jgi:hypothetical protein
VVIVESAIETASIGSGGQSLVCDSRGNDLLQIHMLRSSLIVCAGPPKKSQLDQRAASRDTAVSMSSGKIQETVLTSSLTPLPSHWTLDFGTPEFGTPHLELQPLFAANSEIYSQDEVETEKVL